MIDMSLIENKPDRERLSITLGAKFAFTAWMVIWTVVVWQAQGPQNFWWLCNVAQFVLLIGLWANSRLLISSQASTVVVVGAVWAPDVLLGLVLGDSPTGMTAYMFDPRFSLTQRAASLYHMAVPIFVVWLCWRYGYDRRGVRLQWLIGTAAVIGGWLVGDEGRNLNYVHAPFGIEQVWLPDWAWLPLLCLLSGLLIYVPGHLVLRSRLFGGLARQ